MTESKIFINGERPRVRYIPEDQSWWSYCPCGGFGSDDIADGWRDAFDWLIGHVRSEHL